MPNDINLVWFRQDLRLNDNPAIIEASKNNQPTVFIYVLDDINSKDWKLGSARRVWLHYSLLYLQKNLKEKYAANLVIKQGDANQEIVKFCQENDVKNIFWNRCYEPWRIARDKEIKTQLSKHGISVESLNGSLLYEPWNIKNKSGSWFKVFTPFWKSCLNDNPTPREIKKAPEKIALAKNDYQSLKIKDLNLLPNDPDWANKMLEHWDISENAAVELLNNFLEDKVSNYEEQRNDMDIESTSILSPYLANGQISPHQIYWATESEKYFSPEKTKAINKFMAEVGWREFSYHLLYHFPELPDKNFKEQFDKFPWDNGKQTDIDFKKWQKGQTGYPIVDAAMRELWQTGFMHNRARMIVASFLTKDLFIRWQEGAKWFWDCLFDADLANNSASWQWTAGSGADASPYFRVFNPILQGEKFDTSGEYVRKWVPELSKLETKYIHRPWEAPKEVLEQANVVLGDNYPMPIVDHKQARDKALRLYSNLKKS